MCIRIYKSYVSFWTTRIKRANEKIFQNLFIEFITNMNNGFDFLNVLTFYVHKNYNNISYSISDQVNLYFFIILYSSETI